MNFLLRKDEAEKLYLKIVEANTLLNKKANIDDVESSLEKKVNIIEGKGLSANDFTNTLKTKLNGIETGATRVIVDTALNTISTNPVQNKVLTGKITTIESNVDITSGTVLNIQADIDTITTEEFTKMLSDEGD